MIRQLALSLAVVLASCASPKMASQISQYSAAISVLDTQTRVCAIKKRSRLFFDRNEDSEHLEILEYGPVPPDRKGRICVLVEVTYIGRDTGTVICMDAVSDYGIRITSVVSTGIAH